MLRVRDCLVTLHGELALMTIGLFQNNLVIMNICYASMIMHSGFGNPFYLKYREYFTVKSRIYDLLDLTMHIVPHHMIHL